MLDYADDTALAGKDSGGTKGRSEWLEESENIGNEYKNEIMIAKEWEKIKGWWSTIETDGGFYVLGG